MNEEIEEVKRLRKNVLRYGKACSAEEKYFAHVIYVLEKRGPLLVRGRIPELGLGGRKFPNRVRRHFIGLLSDFKEYPFVSLRKHHLDLHLSDCKASQKLAAVEAGNYAKVAELLSARIKKLEGLTPFVSLTPAEIMRLREFAFHCALQHEKAARQFNLENIAELHGKVAQEFRRIAHLIALR